MVGLFYIKLIGFVDGSDVGWEKKNGDKDAYKILP